MLPLVMIVNACSKAEKQDVLDLLPFRLRTFHSTGDGARDEIRHSFGRHTFATTSRMSRNFVLIKKVAHLQQLCPISCRSGMSIAPHQLQKAAGVCHFNSRKIAGYRRLFSSFLILNSFHNMLSMSTTCVFPSIYLDSFSKHRSQIQHEKILCDQR